MTTYSMAAYELAVRFVRSKRTIMVEGPSDKRVITRMILEHGTARGRDLSCVVDESAIVKDPLLSGKGSKGKVETIAATIGPDNHAQFNWLVDREWEGVDISKPESFSCPETSQWGLRTKGHSIENYWLRHDAFSKYLRLFFGDLLSVDFFSDLERRFFKMLQAAAAYSFTAKECSIIKRCGEAITMSDVAWNGTEYFVVPAFSTRMQERGVMIDIASAINAELQKHSLLSASPEVLQWICHGHLGEEMIRACAANLASEHGALALTVEQVEEAEGLKSSYLTQSSLLNLKKTQSTL